MALGSAALGGEAIAFSPLVVCEAAETPAGPERRMNRRARGTAAYVRLSDATGEVSETGRQGLR